jgi:hypothetical protein
MAIMIDRLRRVQARLANTPEKVQELAAGIPYDSDTPDEAYFVQSPERLLRSGRGICYDIVELQRDLLSRLGVELKTFFAHERNGSADPKSLPTHTFLVYRDGANRYLWMEASWKTRVGIHGPYACYGDAVKAVSGLLRTEARWKSVRVAEYPRFDYAGMRLDDFAGKIISDVGRKEWD